MTLGKRVKDMRGARSQREIAEATGLTQGMISKIERAKHPNLPIETLRKLAEALGVTLAELVDPDNAAKRRKR